MRDKPDRCGSPQLYPDNWPQHADNECYPQKQLNKTNVSDEVLIEAAREFYTRDSKKPLLGVGEHEQAIGDEKETVDRQEAEYDFRNGSAPRRRIQVSFHGIIKLWWK